MSTPVLVTGRGGLGDAIYARPFVREVRRQFPEVYVSTSWPEIFADMDVRCVKRTGGLAVQQYHGEAAPAALWSEPPVGARTVSLRYRWARLAARRSVLWEMEALSGIAPRPLRLDLPPLPQSPIPGRYAVVRPPSHRLDYPAPNREPMPEYLAAAADALRTSGLRVVTLAHLVPGLEEPMGTVPADVRFEHGELPLPQALAVLAGASIIVSGPSWMLPAALAARAPMLVIAGGIGGRNNPDALVDKRLHAAKAVTWLLPDEFCMCRRRGHDCPKAISNFGAKLDLALSPMRRAA